MPHNRETIFTIQSEFISTIRSTSIFHAELSPLSITLKMIETSGRVTSQGLTTSTSKQNI